MVEALVVFGLIAAFLAVAALAAVVVYRLWSATGENPSPAAAAPSVGPPAVAPTVAPPAAPRET